MAASFPKFSKKLVGVSISPQFREAVKLQSVSIPTPGPGELLVCNKFAGVNASEINWTAGRYDRNLKPPYATGMEGIGQVVKVGENCRGFKPGDSVGYMSPGAFSEYIILSSKRVFPVPRPDPSFLTFLVSGLTASISLEKIGEPKAGENVLVTAAAGGTGQFAVQLAKLAGCHVIGTCSTDDKVKFLKQLGCDRPINYKKEDLKKVLKEEYPNGVDVVYESVGGEVCNTCIKNLAVGGRLILIGFISSYQQATGFSTRPTLPLYQILLSKSASIRGFFLNNHFGDMPSHFARLVELYTTGKLIVNVDKGQNYPGGPFIGLESVYEAVDYLYSGKSAGKVVVEIDAPTATSKL